MGYVWSTKSQKQEERRDAGELREKRGRGNKCKNEHTKSKFGAWRDGSVVKVLFQRFWVLFLTPTRQFTTILSSVSREFNTLFCISQALYT